jgi:hypothetical protein
MSTSLTKRPLPLHALDGGDLVLDFAHRWWRARCQGGGMPSRAVVDDWAFRLLVDDAGWIDVQSPEPADWQLGPMEGWLGRLPSAAQGEAEATARIDLAALRLSGTAWAQDLGFSCDVSWRQLVLPHADFGAAVHDLLVVTVARPVADITRRRPAETDRQP